MRRQVMLVLDSKGNELITSPVEVARKSGPMGNGNWPGYEKVYANISEACNKMALTKHVYLSGDHVDTMGDLGSGHEERMKYRQMWLRAYGWIK